jgi:hypothetical protein
MANEVAGQTLQPTALLHGAWLRLSQQSRSEWKNREQFFAVAAHSCGPRAPAPRPKKLWRLGASGHDAVELPFWIQWRWSPGHPELCWPTINSGPEAMMIPLSKGVKRDLRSFITFLDKDSLLIQLFYDFQAWG